MFGFALASPHAYQVTLPWLWGNGGAMLSADLSRSLVAQPEAQAALQWLVDLTLVHEVSPPSPPPPAPPSAEPVVRRVEDIVPSGPELFAEGRVAMLYHWWQLPERFTGRYGRAPQFTPALAQPPRGSVEPVSLLHQSGYQIGKATDAPDAAWTFLAWWTGQAAQRWYRTSSSWSTRADPPARRSLATELADRYGPATVAALGYARHVPPASKNPGVATSIQPGPGIQSGLGSKRWKRRRLEWHGGRMRSWKSGGRNKGLRSPAILNAPQHWLQAVSRCARTARRSTL